MTASLIAQQEARGVRFDAIAAADRQIAQAFARRAELVDEARRYGAATAVTARPPPGTRPAFPGRAGTPPQWRNANSSANWHAPSGCRSARPRR